SNFKNTPLALDVLAAPKTIALYESLNIFTKRELHARHEIVLEDYIKKVQIEARTLGYLATNHVLPAAIQYQNTLIENVKGLKDLGLKKDTYAAQLNIVEIISGHVQQIND